MSRTFEYLDELIEVMFLLEGVQDAILNWQSGNHSEAQEAYDNTILREGFKESSVEESYVFWKSDELLRSVNSSRGNQLKEAIVKLKRKGYT